MANAKADTHEQRQAAAARKAAGILQEDAPRTAAEQAAIDALDERRWVLWHAKDYSLGVIRLLSVRDLLRDTKREQQQASADKFWSADAERRRSADRNAIGLLDDLIEQAADQLDAGGDPAQVAKVLRTTRDAISDRREAATSVSAT